MELGTSRSGAGGKVVANRRKERIAATPYDRAPQPSPLKSPNWFSGVVVPSARAIASGAGKLLSSIFSESDSSSDDEEDFASEDDIYNNNLPEIPCNQENTLNEKYVTSSEMVQYRQESRLSVWKSETKKIIEQLIMKETFSREEHDRLMKVIDSRVIDSSMCLGEKSSCAGSSGNKFNHENADNFEKAVQEAKRWFQEKNAGLSSGTELPQGSKSNLHSEMLEHVETWGGSPGYVARSYMKTRPSWASSSEADAECSVSKLIHLSSSDHAEEPHCDMMENHSSIINVEGNCVLLSEAFMEIPVICETTTSGDLVLYKEQSLDIVQSSTMEKHDVTVGEQQGRKAMKYHNSRRRRKR